MIFNSKAVSLFRGEPKLILHGAYHKMGTVWFMRVLQAVAEFYGLTLQKCNECSDTLNEDVDIAIANHSQLDLEQVGDFIGSHMIRDPRDCIVSGYFYHLWTNEAWALQPSEEFGGLSYQEHLQQLNESDGIQAEIFRFEKYVKDYRLREWNYHDERILEIKYEDLLVNEPKIFAELFRHYGFSEKAVRKSVQIANQFTFKRVSGRSVGDSSKQNHLRSGQPGQWKTSLSENHIRSIEELFGDVIELMGYSD